MKGKRYTTEEKIRILRAADRGEKSIPDLCREENVSEVTFPRWKKQFGHREIKEARRLKGRERENSELKKMRAESPLKNRVWEAVCEKNCKPGPSPGGGATRSSCGDVFPTGRVSNSTTGTVHLRLSWANSDLGAGAIKATAARTLGRPSALRVSADRGMVTPRRLAGGQTTHSTTAPS